MRLAKQRERHYLKREPRPLRLQEPGLARRDERPLLHGCRLGLGFRPRISSHLIRGQLLSGWGCQEQDEYQRDERGQKQTHHWLIPSFTLAGVMRRADAWRVAVSFSYILIRGARQRFTRQRGA